MQFQIISARELISLLPLNNALLIDLRAKEDFERGHITGAVWADWETLASTIHHLIEKTETPIEKIVLYCDHGNISLLAARELSGSGYPIITVNGGYNAFMRALHSK